MKEKIKKIIFEVFDEFNETFGSEKILEKNLQEKLFGENGKLDSLGIVNLIVMLEEAIEDRFQISITIANERAMLEKNSPFLSAESLLLYITQLLEEVKS